MPVSVGRDHLFISYAVEDIDFAEWLEAKLVGAGFQVWRDGSKLLGGEPYPREIDVALKERTFRVLAILSPHSIRKANPTKERTLALNLAKQRGENDFLIPLNLTGLNPTELDWMTSDLTFIAFSPSWFEGLGRLLRKLESIEAPRRPRPDMGELSRWLAIKGAPAARRETIHSNVFPIRTMPAALLRIQSTSERLGPFLDQTPSVRETDRISWTLVRPPKLPVGSQVVEVPWSIPFNGLPREELERKTVRLLRLHVWQFCDHKGLRRAREEQKTYSYFTGRADGDLRLPFKTTTGRNTTLKVVGVRTFATASGKRDACRYHLAPDFTPFLTLFGVPALVLRFHLYLTDLSGKQLDTATAHRRRRRIGKAMMNHQWLVRQLAVMQHLSSGGATLNLSAADAPPILVSSLPLAGAIDVGISNPREVDIPEEPDERAILDDSDEPEELGY